jgi:Gram-negative bacterial TonB protein C-terminal
MVYRALISVFVSWAVFGQGVLKALPARPHSVERHWKEIQNWAGSETPDFNPAKLESFLDDYSKNLSAGRLELWNSWLRALAVSKSLQIRTWAQARLLEAGDFKWFPNFEAALVNHARAISQMTSGLVKETLVDPPPNANMPSTYRLDRESSFWPAFEKTIRQKEDLELDAGFYCVWCFSTNRSQRALIFDLATQTKPKITARNPKLDPWNDPRFWIVTDWALSWGSHEDFEALSTRFPEGNARYEFKRIFRRVEGVPIFWSGPGLSVSARNPDDKPTNLKNAPVVDFDFSEIKVSRQPSSPLYPAEAKARKMINDLSVEMCVDPQGKVFGARPSPGPWLSFFASSAIDYAARWEFTPASINGVPQYARFILKVQFRLRD